MAFTKKGNWMGNFVNESRKIPPPKYIWKLGSKGKWIRYDRQGRLVPFGRMK